MPELRPYILDRTTLSKPWGGRALEERLAIPLPADSAIGESWELFDRPAGSSVLREGEGSTLHDLVREHGSELLGSRTVPTCEGRFPLLTKFIDARQRLSVQVHPGPEQARPHGDGPKDEAWVVLYAGPEASIVRGFRPGTTRDQVVAAAREGAAIEALLHSFTPKAGDVISIPYGVVHAIGPDVVVFEVQQNSDLTFRFWDWGSDRPLHIDDALTAVRVDDQSPPTVLSVPIDARGDWLVRTPNFRMRRLRFDEPATLGVEGSFKILTVIEGMAAIGWRSQGTHTPIPIRRAETMLIPASVPALFVSPIGPFECLWIDGESGGAN